MRIVRPLAPNTLANNTRLLPAPSPHLTPCTHAQVCKSLRFAGTSVPRGYEEKVQRALWVFRHQRVFCPRTRTCTHLRPLPPGGLGAADVDVPSAVPQKGGEEEGASGEGG